MQCLKCGNEFDPDLYDCPVCSEVRKQSGRINRIVSAVEDILIVLFLGVMVIMVMLQVIMRNMYQSGIVGGDDLVRHLVLWIAFFGAGVATRSNAHVRMDALTNFMPERLLKYSDVVVSLFSFIISAIMVYASVKFLYIEYQSHGHSPFLNLPLWMLQSILPVGYLLLACRFAHNGILRIQETMKGGSECLPQ
jgi:TRAP-type C4-dicarboxylate transport system permease small subunit